MVTDWNKLHLPGSTEVLVATRRERPNLVLSWRSLGLCLEPVPPVGEETVLLGSIILVPVDVSKGLPPPKYRDTCLPTVTGSGTPLKSIQFPRLRTGRAPARYLYEESDRQSPTLSGAMPSG